MKLLFLGSLLFVYAFLDFCVFVLFGCGCLSVLVCLRVFCLVSLFVFVCWLVLWVVVRLSVWFSVFVHMCIVALTLVCARLRALFDWWWRWWIVSTAQALL